MDVKNVFAFSYSWHVLIFLVFLTFFTLKRWKNDIHILTTNYKNSSGDEIANVNFLRPYRTILQNIIRC